MVPTSLFIILNMPKPRSDLNISSLKWIGCGSSQLLTAYQDKFDAKFGIKVGNLYGLSETGPTHIDYPLDNNWNPGSIGYALSVNECKILDDNDNICGVGISGEIVIKGDNVFIDYYKNTDLYQESVKNGYFYTGDIGYLGSDAKFYFSGRKKDLIIKGGVNILPAEIEEILIDHPNIGEVAVFGIPDQFVGEEICAAIQLKKDTNQKEILDFCSKQLSQYKLPKEIIIIDELPKGPSGKILKRVLREHYVKKTGKNKHVG
jgi:long-chain acyl-CoA synthetase